MDGIIDAESIQNQEKEVLVPNIVKGIVNLYPKTNTIRDTFPKYLTKGLVKKPEEVTIATKNAFELPAMYGFSSVSFLDVIVKDENAAWGVPLFEETPEVITTQVAIYMAYAIDYIQPFWGFIDKYYEEIYFSRLASQSESSNDTFLQSYYTAYTLLKESSEAYGAENFFRDKLKFVKNPDPTYINQFQNYYSKFIDGETLHHATVDFALISNYLLGVIPFLDKENCPSSSIDQIKYYSLFKGGGLKIIAGYPNAGDNFYNQRSELVRPAVDSNRVQSIIECATYHGLNKPTGLNSLLKFIVDNPNLQQDMIEVLNN